MRADADKRWEWWRGTHFSIPPESHKTGGRTGRARTIAVTAATARMIEEWRPGASVQWVARAAGDIRRESRPANNAYLEWFRLAREHAGLPEGVTPYWLRTSFTAHARRAGAEPRVSAASAGRVVHGRGSGVGNTDRQSILSRSDSGLSVGCSNP